MSNIIFKTNQKDWHAASVAKKELAFHRARNRNGIFDEAIAKEEELIRSFKTNAQQAA